MKITYHSKYYANIEFDYCFTMDMSDAAFDIDFLIERAIQQMAYYRFTHADIIDARTGEVLCSLSDED